MVIQSMLIELLRNRRINVNVKTKFYGQNKREFECAPDLRDITKFARAYQLVMEKLEISLRGGWTKRLQRRQTGVTAGKIDVTLFAPDGTKIR